MSISADATQWSVYELSFRASDEHHWNEFPLQVTFENGSTRIQVDGYWDGNSTWKARFAPTETGAWRWKSSSVDSEMDGLTGSFHCIAPTSSQIASNPNYRGHIRVGPTGRYFTYADGTPFFYLGDTCWSMNEERCGLGNNEDGAFYVWMRDRKSKGLTVINHWFFKSRHPAKDKVVYPSCNEGGEPFKIDQGEYAFDELKPDYYRYVDVRWQALWQNGFVMAGPPTWICKPRHCMNLEQAQNISRYIMARYGVYNMVWALSGEYSYGETRNNPPWDQVSTWNDLGNFVAAHNPFNHPISIHPGPAVYHASSSIDFHDEKWLDHNWLQTGQYPKGQHRVAVWAKSDYDKSPTRPVLQAEGFYEGQEKGANSFHVRYQPWTAFLNGACGAVYGANAIWTFDDPNDPRTIAWRNNSMSWKEGLELPGSSHLKHVVDFFTAIEWWKLTPHREWLRVDGEPPPMPTEDDISPPHCAAEEGEIYVIYIPRGNVDKTISIAHLASRAYHAKWYNPRDGSYLDINDGEPVNTNGRDEWTLPPRPDDEDWVCLVLNT